LCYVIEIISSWLEFITEAMSTAYMLIQKFLFPFITMQLLIAKMARRLNYSKMPVKKYIHSAYDLKTLLYIYF